MRWTLPADHASASLARSHVTQALAGREQADDVALAASELVTNAVEHGTPPVELALEIDPSRIRVTVSNTQDAGAPRLTAAHADDSGGRGLAMIGLLADRWGWEHDHGRLLVWAEFSA